MQPIDIPGAFTYHPPADDQQIADYQALRAGGRDLAERIAALTPQGPEQTLAIRKVQEAVMWANAAIACQPGSARH